MRLALSLERANAGSSMAARMAMMAMTTNNSMRVNPWPGALEEHPPGTRFEVESMSRADLLER